MRGVCLVRTHGAQAHYLSPRKLHPVLRIERAEKDRFITLQKNYFFGCLMNVFLGVAKEIAFLALRSSVFLKGAFLYILRCSECARPRALEIFEVEFATKHKNPKDWRV